MEKSRKCKHCNKIFDNIEGKIFSNHVRWCNQNPKKYYLKDIKCKYCFKEFHVTTIGGHESLCKLNPKNIVYCKECGKIVLSKNCTKFCSRTCAAHYNNKNRDKTNIFKKGHKWDKIKSKCIECGEFFDVFIHCVKYVIRCDKCRKKINKGRTLKKYYSKCVICDKEFEYESYNVKVRKTCSTDCYRKLLSTNSRTNLNCGGETNWKKYNYKNISMDSSWEVNLAMWLDENNIKWIRSRKIMFIWEDISGKSRRYYPDFLLSDYNIYLDPKNKYLMKKDAFKLDQVRLKHKINLICGSLDYIKTRVSEVAKI